MLNVHQQNRECSGKSLLVIRCVLPNASSIYYLSYQFRGHRAFRTDPVIADCEQISSRQRQIAALSLQNLANLPDCSVAPSLHKHVLMRSMESLSVLHQC